MLSSSSYRKKVVGVTLASMLILTTSISWADCLPGQRQEANLIFQSASELLQQKQWDAAVAEFQSAITVCPEHVDATRGIGEGMAGKASVDGFTQSIPYFKKVIELRGAEAEAGDFANLGRSFAKLKRYKEARAEYMKAERLAPTDCGVLYNLGVMHYASGFHSQSVEVLETALSTCPQIKDHVLKQLSNSADKAAAKQKANGNLEQAKYYSGLMNKYGGAAGGSTAYDLVRQKMSAKDYKGAAVLLDQMLAENPDHTGALLTMARAQDALKNGIASIGYYERYLVLKPQEVKAVGSMIQVMVESGKCSEAVARSEQASNELASLGRKNLAPVLYGWGLALECLGEYDLAKVKFQACASSGNKRYASHGGKQVERMDGLKAVAEAEKKKAAQGG
ncbi:MAG: tetratricopeptide (TPR) repeat protein [Candidatus Krumholzibacteriia bacterium]